MKFLPSRRAQCKSRVTQCQRITLVPKKILVILQFESKFLFHAHFDWGRCSIRRISVVYMNVMYLCSMLDDEIETPKESVERDHSSSAYHIIYAYRLLTLTINHFTLFDIKYDTHTICGWCIA